MVQAATQPDRPIHDFMLSFFTDRRSSAIAKMMRHSLTSYGLTVALGAEAQNAVALAEYRTIAIAISK